MTKHNHELFFSVFLFSSRKQSKFLSFYLFLICFSHLFFGWKHTIKQKTTIAFRFSLMIKKWNLSSTVTHTTEQKRRKNIVVVVVVERKDEKINQNIPMKMKTTKTTKLWIRINRNFLIIKISRKKKKLFLFFLLLFFRFYCIVNR